MIESSIQDFPPTTLLQRFRFESGVAPDQSLFLTLASRPSVSVSIKSEPFPGGSLAANELLILAIPIEDRDDTGLLETARNWIENEAGPADPSTCSRSKTLILQGSQILFHEGRIAILAPEARLEELKRVLVEVAFFERQLRELESAVGAGWSQLDSDIPLSSHFGEKSIPKLNGLQKRSVDVLLLRARLARISEQVHSPHIHPPTHSSQLAERFRERLQMAHRHEILDEQLEVFERVYEAASQRSSDYLLNRSSITLEWVIIILLVAQLLLAGFEILTSTGT